MPLAVEDQGGPGRARGGFGTSRRRSWWPTGRGMEPDRANGQEKVGGGMLGALATPLPAYTGGQESGYRSAGHGVVTSLFQDGGELREGEGQAPSQLPEGRHGTTEVAVNPFWSENVKKEIGHYGEEVGAERGAEVRVPEQDQGHKLPQFYTIHGGLSRKDLEELGEIRRKATEELESKIYQEVQRRKQESASDSYKSAATGTIPGMAATPMAPMASVGGGCGGGRIPSRPPSRRPQVPTGSGYGGHGTSAGESLTESLRNLELPKLAVDATAIGFGDWLAIIEPLMSDISSSSAAWWRMTLAAAVKTYDVWVSASPLQRLRLRAEWCEGVLKWPRTEQRGVTMILSAMPEELRREAIATRRMAACELIYRLLVSYQPGGSQERTVLLKDLVEDRLGQSPSVAEVLQAIRLWRRQLGRAEELNVQLPDPLVITSLLTRWADHLGRIGTGFPWSGRNLTWTGGQV